MASEAPDCRALYHRSTDPFMAKLVTLKQAEEQTARATAYVKTYILFPSGMLGLICMLVGIGMLGYQLVATDSYTWRTFAESSGLLLLGGVVGWLQTLYQRWMLRVRPEVFAARMQFVAKRGSRSKRESVSSQPASTSPWWVPVAYLALAGMILAASTMSVLEGTVNPVAGYLMPWAGFFWAKLFFWRKVIQVNR
jgi:hypothetical protein